ncbi:MAG: GGDEF domain-containing protein [Deltaproteobacteria bacterium]|nr:GGDEF domain-containing protein [Deltaproteobacteria bacterium]
MDDDWDDTVAALPGTIDLGPRYGRAYLVVVRGAAIGRVYPLLEGDIVIGRASGADLQLEDEGVSRFHCRLRRNDSGIMVDDLNSRNGTYCNGEKVIPGMPPLAEGDRLQIGTTTVLRFTFDEAADAGETPSPDAHVSPRDALTGMYSRRYFIDRLQVEVAAALKDKGPLSLVLIHVDRFADICLHQGAAFGDELTTAVAKHIIAKIYGDDIIARLAGGSFAMLARSSSPGDTFMLAERLRTSTSSLTVPGASGPEKITLSLAVGSITELRIETANDLMMAAGTALHRARSQGGDRVVLCTQDLLREPRVTTKV